MGLHGARYLHVFVLAGLGLCLRRHVKLARLARETGLFPVFEAEHGEVVRVSKLRRRVPVEEYLRRSDASRSLPQTPRTDVVAQIHFADRNIRRFGLLDEEDGVMEKP